VALRCSRTRKPTNRQAAARAMASADPGFLDDRPDFDGAEACHWNPTRRCRSLVAIAGLDQEVPPSCSRVYREWPSSTSLLLSRTRTLDGRRRGCKGQPRVRPAECQSCASSGRLLVTLLPLDIVGAFSRLRRSAACISRGCSTLVQTAVGMVPSRDPLQARDTPSPRPRRRRGAPRDQPGASRPTVRDQGWNAAPRRDPGRPSR